jgi:hypothetical protein
MNLFSAHVGLIDHSAEAKKIYFSPLKNSHFLGMIRKAIFLKGLF